MEGTVRDWMNDLVVMVDPDTPVMEALALMRRRYIHSVIVNRTAQNPEYGIVTSIDICDDIVAKGNDPSAMKVKDIMTSPLITVDQNLGMQECARIMMQHRIHHLPVVDANGQLIGMISSTDFLVVAETMGAKGEQTLN
jgi:CBS domain-containing protein